MAFPLVGPKDCRPRKLTVAIEESVALVPGNLSRGR